MQSETWATIDALIATNRVGDYDQAIHLLKNLWRLGLSSGRSGEVQTRINQLRQQHADKSSFLRQLNHVLPPPRP
jgi:hypothetical protein